MKIEEAIKDVEEFTKLYQIRSKMLHAEDMVLAFNMVCDCARMSLYLKAQYKQRLKSDMVAMLEELDLQIDEIQVIEDCQDDYQAGTVHGLLLMRDKCKKIIQQKINALKGEENANN